MTRFHACLRDDDPCRLQPVPGADDALDAAVLFLERRALEAEEGGLSVIVEDRETGARQCFSIDLEHGTGRAC